MKNKKTIFLMYFVLIFSLFNCSCSGRTFSINRNSLKSVKIIKDIIRNDYDIIFELNDNTTEKFENFTSKNLNQLVKVKFEGHIILETSVNTMYRFTIIKGGDFQSEQEAEDFLRINLDDKFIELFNNKTSSEIESRCDSFVDSLISSAVIKSKNFEYKKSILLLDEAERITSIQSEKYQSILIYKLSLPSCYKSNKINWLESCSRSVL